MDDIKNTKKAEDLKNVYEKFRYHYALTLECVKILPWEINVSTMKIDNIFGMNILFTESNEHVDFQKWIDMLHPEDKDRVLPSVKILFDGKINESAIEYRIKKDSGEYIWLKTIAKVRLRDEKGKPLFITGINQDITESKLIEIHNLEREKKIRDSESRLKNAMKIGRMSLWEYNYELEAIITDREMSDIWGLVEYYDRGQPIKAEGLVKYVHPDDRMLCLEKFRHSVANNESFELSFRIVVNGVVKFIHFISEVLFDDNGKPFKMVGIAQDVTKIKSLEDSLARQYEGLRFIAEKAGLGLWEFNVRNSLISTITNDEKSSEPDSVYEKIPVDEFMKKIHPEDSGMFQSKLNFHVDKGGDIADFDIRLNTEDEIYRWFHITAVLDKTDDSGNPLIYRGLYQDITERKEIEGRLYQSQKMEAIGRLAGGIAHDFNNILQVILGYGSLVLMDAEQDSDMLENISHIIDSGEKAKSLVRQLLLFARREKFRPNLVELNEVASGFTKMLKRVIGENITLSFNPDNEFHYIHADTGQLEQIFMNLCINSRDAIDGSGSITIKTKNITIDGYWPCFDNSIPPGTYVMLSVSDTGAGIPADNIDQIFEPFFTTKDKNRGTGLGLATVYSIVKQHSSYIDVHSIEGKGTTFSIYFPVFGDEISDKVYEEKETAERHSYGGETVLLAEDDDLIRKYTSRILIDSGFKVITASDGEIAVKLFNENRDMIDLLIFDVVMPKKNGWDVYNEIGGVKNKIPVVFFSGYDQNLLPHDAAGIIPMVYVQKPFKYYAIIKAVHDLLDGKR
ncbi:MAG TPA: PAS domain-containing protein [Spirochaetota bacterium]|nr:PAS domain-containing protein [Spirochaetota bacterium]HPS87059.1 PAS domain-containing protein [Spirochaetota bacterium]